MPDGPQVVALKFSIGPTVLKRQLIMLLTGIPEVPTNDVQAKQLQDMDRFLAETMDKTCEWAIDFGAMYLNMNVERMKQIVEFVAQHPASVEFDNLNPLRERLDDFIAELRRLADCLKPEQFNHQVPVAVEPAPSVNGGIVRG